MLPTENENSRGTLARTPNPRAPEKAAKPPIPHGQAAPPSNPRDEQAGGSAVLDAAEAVQGGLAKPPDRKLRMSKEAENQLKTGQQSRAVTE